MNHTLHPNGFSDDVPSYGQFEEFKTLAFDEKGSLRPEVKDRFESAAKRLERGALRLDTSSAYESVTALRDQQASERLAEKGAGPKV